MADVVLEAQGAMASAAMVLSYVYQNIPGRTGKIWVIHHSTIYILDQFPIPFVILQMW